MVASHDTYGAAAAAAASDDGPVQSPLISPEITDWKLAAVDCNSLDSPSQADAAACNDSAPGPE